MKKAKVFILVLLSFLIVLMGFNVLQSKNQENKQYTIKSEKENNFLLSIAFYVIKPIIETYIDSRLEKEICLKYIEKKHFRNKSLKIVDIKDGSGETIICGQSIVATITEKSGDQKKQSISLGSEEDWIFNIGLIGMKKGGKRLIHADREFTIEILDVLDGYPQQMKEMKVFKNKSFNQRAQMCGDNISIHFKINNFKMNTVAEGSSTFIIGSKKVPLAIEQSALEIQKGNKVFALAPKELFLITESMNEDIKKVFSNIDFLDDFYIVEIELI